MFLAFQYPMEIPGVATMTFLRASVNATRKKRGVKELTTPEFMKFAKAKAAELGVSDDMLKRPLNAGFSGGEKKRMEILQMSLLEPTLCVLDETDSGLDIDAIRIVSEGATRMRSPGPRHAGHHALSAAAQLHRARQGARACPRAHPENAAARSWRWSWRDRVTPNSKGRPREVSEVREAGQVATDLTHSRPDDLTFHIEP